MRIEQVISFQHVQDSIREHVILYKGEAFTFYDMGLTRYVFTNGDNTKVIKILIEKEHFDYNLEEGDIYKNASDEVKSKMARTELTYNGTIIEQEFCLPIKFSDKKLNIAQMLFAKSCRNEVGWNKEDKLVCFDLDEYMRY